MKRLLERYPATIAVLCLVAFASAVAIITGRIVQAVPLWVFVLVVVVLIIRHRLRGGRRDG